VAHILAHAVLGAIVGAAEPRTSPAVEAVSTDTGACVPVTQSHVAALRRRMCSVNSCSSVVPGIILWARSL